MNTSTESKRSTRVLVVKPRLDGTWQKWCVVSIGSDTKWFDSKSAAMAEAHKRGSNIKVS